MAVGAESSSENSDRSLEDTSVIVYCLKTSGTSFLLYPGFIIFYQMDLLMSLVFLVENDLLEFVQKIKQEISYFNVQ